MTTPAPDDEMAALLRAVIEEHIPFNRLLGVRVTLLGRGVARLEVPFREDLIGDPVRPAVHGGVLSALLDACGGAAVMTLMTPADRISTIDLRVDYLLPGAMKPLVCQSTVVRLGNRVASVDGQVFHPDAPDRLIATGKAVYNVRRGSEPAAGPATG